MMVVNNFSKIVVLVPLQSTDVDAITDAFFGNFISHFRLLLTITMDPDKWFMAKFWQALLKAHGTAL